MTAETGSASGDRRAGARRRFLALPAKRRLMTYALLLTFLFALPALWCCCKPHRRSDAPLTAGPSAEDSPLRARLERHVRFLAEEIGDRSSSRLERQRRAAEYIAAEWRRMGYEVARLGYPLDGGEEAANLEVVVRGREPALGAIVVGAHYDTVPGSPGADDNASGVALLLEVARALAGAAPDRDLRFVAFACEEPPHFQTESMGSKRYADALAGGGAKVDAMISLESLGYFRDEKGSQQYPAIVGLFFPSRGNFVGVVGNLGASSLVTRIGKLLIEHSSLPVECASLPAWIAGVDWSDHWSFALHDVPAVMLTDTAPFRNPHYHMGSDLPDTLHYGALTALAESLPKVIAALAAK
ncbi:MAG: M20/M25/M40 family metallo-hydrolase [Planctomycetes bacterium]|nr:M20/M25/M40 family metallo-hydrolase [Planctomycetota bacterium]